MNNINVIGRLVREVEVNTKGKTTYCRNAIAVKRMYDREKTDFFNIIAFGKTAEIMEQYLDKGSQIGVSGRMESTSKDGKVYWDLVVENITLLDRANSNNNNNNSHDEVIDDDDEFPF